MIFKANVRSKQVFITDKNILVPDCIIFGNGANSDGLIISDNDKWYYIPLQADNWTDLLTDIIESLNQVVKSVSTTQFIAPQHPAGNQAVITTITADLKPNIEKLEKLKQNLV